MSGIGGIGGGARDPATSWRCASRSSTARSCSSKSRAARPRAERTAPAQAGGFAGALKSALDSVNASQARPRDCSEAYERGEVTDVAKVMLARQEAGVAFEATLQVRNRCCPPTRTSCGWECDRWPMTLSRRCRSRLAADPPLDRSALAAAR